MPGFSYLKAATLAEAFALKQEYGDGARFVAGGTDVLPLIKRKLLAPKVLISLRGLVEFKGIRESAETIFIGSGVTLREMEKSPLIKALFPALHDAVCDMASVQIRNVATLGGNIVNASPGADSAAPLLIHEAEVLLIRADGSRQSLPLAEFFLGPKRVGLAAGELVEGFVLARPAPGSGSAYFKFMKRRAMDLAHVGVGVKVELDGAGLCRQVRIGLATVGPTPLSARLAAAVLEGRIADEESLLQAAEAAAGEISPIDDFRGRAWHKTEVVKSLLVKAVKLACDRAQA